MKFLDLFAGIGGFRLGLEAEGFTCAGYVEFDKFARASYEAIHDTEGEWTAHDITNVSDEDLRLLRDEKEIDIIAGGFPCQAFSIAGNRGGFKDTRGTLFFEIARFAEQIKPRILLLENVKGLLSHDKGKTFATILNTLDELGYDAEWQVLNSKDFGVPQSRERVFIVGHLRGERGREVFPLGGINGETNELSGQSTNTLTARYNGVGNGSYIIEGKQYAQKEEPRQGVAIREATKKGYDTAYPGDSVNYTQPNSKTRRGRVGDGIANTLDTGCHQGVVTEDVRIRKLTPKECWRLQGFPDWAFNKAQAVNSDSQLYKQAGNAVTVNVIQAIAKKINEEAKHGTLHKS